MTSTRKLLLIAALLPALAQAHDARPLSVIINEQTEHVYRVNLVVPPTVTSENQPQIIWPAGCESHGHSSATTIESSSHKSLVTCTNGLENSAIRVKYALFNPSLATFIRMLPLDGVPRTAVLPPQTLEWVVPATLSRLHVARDYALLGIGHIWKGVDHLLFVVGLLLLAGTGRRIVLAITGFSMAHSITLSLSALGFVHIPVPPTEAAIALSILFLATEIARGPSNTLAWRYPLLVSTSFGLLHGLGFAAALGEIGLPPIEIPTALLFFSIGVELGQFVFILPIIAAMLWIARRRASGELVPWIDHATTTAGVAAPWCIGILASFWFAQRITVFIQ
jgi:hydrogenase/urease accessory protein HupE